MSESRVAINVDLIYEWHPFAFEALEKLEKAGYQAVLIGGIVRDALLSQFDPTYPFDPIEVDIATSSEPHQIKELFPELAIKEVGEAFGVLIVKSPDGQNYEIATFREESEYDGRRPGIVHHVRELERDVKRRDFTINGLAATKEGEVIDHVGGISDLRSKIIRTIGNPDERFREDYLRLLRAMRFACKIGADLDRETRQSIKLNAARISQISPERVGVELLGILATKHSAKGIELMDELGLLDVILPEVAACKDVPQPEKYHPEGDVFVHSLLALKNADNFIEDPVVKLAVLLHDIGKPIALDANEGVNMAGHDKIGADLSKAICRRLRLSGADTSLIELLVSEHQRIGYFSQLSRSKQVRFLKKLADDQSESLASAQKHPRLASLIQLMIADCQASAMKSNGWLSVLTNIQQLLFHLHELDAKVKADELISGNDIIALGMKEGPEIGQILEEIYEEIYSGEIETRTEALGLAKRLADNLKKDGM